MRVGQEYLAVDCRPTGNVNAATSYVDTPGRAYVDAAARYLDDCIASSIAKLSSSAGISGHYGWLAAEAHDGESIRQVMPPHFYLILHAA